jgi:nitroreductase
MAPSGGNRQPARYIVVRDKKRKEKLVPLCGSQKHVAKGAAVLVVCSRDIGINRGGYMGELSMLVDVAISFTHVVLAARAEGLATCWIGTFDNSGIKEFLKIPNEYQVVALTPLGYPEGDLFIGTSERLKLEQIMCEEEWQFPGE